MQHCVGRCAYILQSVSGPVPLLGREVPEDRHFDTLQPFPVRWLAEDGGWQGIPYRDRTDGESSRATFPANDR